MSGQLTIEIPVEPWLYQYLSARLGQSPWKMSMRNYEGKLLLSNMGSKNERYKKLECWDKKSDKLTYKLIVPWHYANDTGKYNLNEYGVESFVTYYQTQFKRDLILWVESRMGLKQLPTGKGSIYIKQAILDFCKKNGIDEDHIPFETLKKRVYRAFAEKKKQAVFID
jgi:hypothetical protein